MFDLVPAEVRVDGSCSVKVASEIHSDEPLDEGEIGLIVNAGDHLKAPTAYGYNGESRERAVRTTER